MGHGAQAFPFCMARIGDGIEVEPVAVGSFPAADVGLYCCYCCGRVVVSGRGRVIVVGGLRAPSAAVLVRRVHCTTATTT